MTSIPAPRPSLSHSERAAFDRLDAELQRVRDLSSRITFELTEGDRSLLPALVESRRIASDDVSRWLLVTGNILANRGI